MNTQAVNGQAAQPRASGRRLIKTRFKVETVLENLIKDVEDYLEECGGCDHSVGICVCPMVRHLDEARELLGLPRHDVIMPGDTCEEERKARGFDRLRDPIPDPREPRDYPDAEDIQDRNPMRCP